MSALRHPIRLLARSSRLRDASPQKAPGSIVLSKLFRRSSLSRKLSPSKEAFLSSVILLLFRIRVEVRLGRAPRGKILPMSRLLHTTFPTSPPVPGVLPPAPRGLPSCLHPGGSAHSEATRESRASSSARPGASIPAMTTSPGRSTLYWPCAAPESPQRAPPVCGAEKIQRYVYILV